MNERIKELALDAGLLLYVDHETPRHYFIDAGDDQENVEKFAELIVRECALLCNDPVVVLQHWGLDLKSE